MELRFEWFVAWRHLYERGRRAGVLAHAFAAFAFVVALVAIVLMQLTPKLGPIQVLAGKIDWRQIFHVTAVISLELAVLTGVFGSIRKRLSMFSTISAYGVFLGTMALVIVLSVMNGFEADLRAKILGANAHLLVTKEDGPFTEWRDVDRRLADIPGILGRSPYVQSEIGVSANSNYAGVIVKGVDPGSVGQVSDLVHNLVDDGALARLWPLSPAGDPQPYENHAAALAPDAAPAPPDAPPGTPDARQAEELVPEIYEAPPDATPAPDGEQLAEVEPPTFDPTAGPTSAPTGEPRTDLPPEAPLELALRPGPAAATPVTSLPALIRDPRTDPLDGMLFGQELAKTLHLFPGQEVQVVSPLLQDTPGGQVPRTRRFRVAGRFFSGMYEYDTRNVYVSMAALQRFLSLGDEVTGFEVKLADLDETAPVIAAIQRALGPGYLVRDWQELNRSLFSALKLEKIAMFLVLTVIILVASFSIVANLIMLVVEKAREIAIMKSMGAPDRTIMRVFMLEGLYLGGIGTLGGLIKGIGTCLMLQRFGLPLNSNVYYIDTLPVEMDPVAITLVSLAGLAISFLATIYPARVAARLRPVEGLRRD